MSMPSGPDLTRKVSQLDNDVGAIYNMLNAIQTTQQRHGNRLDELGLEISEVRRELGEMRGEIRTITSEQVSQAGKLDRILDLLRAPEPGAG
jgi:chromosome segregation ATPase